MDTIYQVTIIVLLLIGTVSYLMIKLFSRFIPWGGGHVGYHGAPVHRDPPTGGIGGVLLLLVLVGALFYILVPQEDLIRIFNLGSDSGSVEVVGASLSHSSQAVDLSNELKSEITVDHSDLAVFEPVQEYTPPVSIVQFGWQFGAFNDMYSANKKCAELVSRYSDIEIIDTGDPEGRFKVMCAVRNSREEVNQWQRHSSPREGFPTQFERLSL